MAGCPRVRCRPCRSSRLVGLAELLEKMKLRMGWLCLGEGLVTGEFAGDHDRPAGSRQFGERHGDEALRLSGPQSGDPLGEVPLRLPAWRRTDVEPTASNLRMYGLPCLVMAPSLALPPLEFCFGVNPARLRSRAGAMATLSPRPTRRSRGADETEGGGQEPLATL